MFLYLALFLCLWVTLGHRVGDISLPHSFVNLTPKIRLHFQFEQNSSITCAFVLHGPNQFFSFALGTGMVDSDMWTFEFEGNQLILTDRKTFGYISPLSDIVQNGTEDLHLLGYEVTDNQTIVKVNRLLVTGDPLDHEIKIGRNRALYATRAGAKKLVPTNDFGRILINLTEGFQGDAENITFSIPTHGIVMLLSWGLIFDINLFILRWRRNRKMTIPFYYIHMILIILSWALATANVYGIVRGLKIEGIEGLSTELFRKAHGIIGFFSIFTSTGSLLGGLFLLSQVKTSTPNKVVFGGKQNHRFGGYLLYVLTRINFILGGYFVGGYIQKLVYAEMGLALIAHLWLNRKIRREFYQEIKNEQKLQGKTLTKDQQQLIEKVNSTATREQIVKEFPKLQWVLLKDKILDLSSWLHPGGQFLIDNAIGREVSMFLRGNHTIELKIDGQFAWSHSTQAYELANSMEIGVLRNQDGVIKLNDLTDASRRWKLTNVEFIQKDLAQLRFETSGLEVKSLPTSLKSFGKHILLEPDQHPELMRPYTLSLALTKKSKNLRNALMRSFETGELSFSLDDAKPEKFLDLFIKDYNHHKGLTKKLFDLDTNSSLNQFKIEGPYGRGLELNENSSGRFVVVCAGTGILPFLDFLNYLLFKLAYDIHVSRGNQMATKEIQKLGFDFNENCLKGFSLVLIGSFGNKETIYGLEILEKLAILNQLLGKNIVDISLTHYSGSSGISTVFGKLDQKILEELIKGEVTRVYVCGPKNFNENIPSELKKAGLPKEKVFFI